MRENIRTRREGTMIGICIEAGLTCPDCETYVPLNAMVPSVRCSACGRNIGLTPENWYSLLDDALKSVPGYEEGEGSRSTIFGDHNFKLTYGRLFPRYSGTKETLEQHQILDGLRNGWISHPESGERTFVRPLPGVYSEDFQGVVAIVGEDPSQLPGKGAGTGIETAVSGPVAFQCPNCGGSLILDGKSRKTSCSFCSTDLYLPDDLWSALHPVKTAERWYFLFDETQRPVEWEREVWDAACDGMGNHYMILEPEMTGTPVLVSTGPDRKPRWRRPDLDLEPETTRGEPKLALTPDGRVLVYSGNKRRLYVISGEDGSTIKELQGVDDPSVPEHERFGMNGCYDFGVFPDGTLFLYRDCGRSDTWGHYMEFQRFDLEGNFLPLWDEAKMQFTFFQKLRRMFSRTSNISDFCNTGSYPVGSREFDIRLTIGPDGSMYMLEFRSLLKLDPTGRRVYLIEELPCDYTTGRPVANEAGEAFIMADRQGDRAEILSVSPDGTQIRTEVGSKVDGGPLERNGILTLSPGGGFTVIGYSGYWADVPRSGMAAEERPSS